MAASAIDVLSRVIVRKANSIISNVETIKDHPTYITKTDIQAEAHEMKGLYEGYLEVANYLEHNDAESIGDFISNDSYVKAKIKRAYEAVKELDSF